MVEARHVVVGCFELLSKRLGARVSVLTRFGQLGLELYNYNYNQQQARRRRTKGILIYLSLLAFEDILFGAGLLESNLCL